MWQRVSYYGTPNGEYGLVTVNLSAPSNPRQYFAMLAILVLASALVAYPSPFRVAAGTNAIPMLVPSLPALNRPNMQSFPALNRPNMQLRAAAGTGGIPDPFIDSNGDFKYLEAATNKPLYRPWVTSETFPATRGDAMANVETFARQDAVAAPVHVSAARRKAMQENEFVAKQPGLFPWLKTRLDLIRTERNARTSRDPRQILEVLPLVFDAEATMKDLLAKVRVSSAFEPIAVAMLAKHIAYIVREKKHIYQTFADRVAFLMLHVREQPVLEELTALKEIADKEIEEMEKDYKLHFQIYRDWAAEEQSESK